MDCLLDQVLKKRPHLIMLTMVNKLVVAAAGIGTHLSYFNRGEHDTYGTQYLGSGIAILLLVAAAHSKWKSSQWAESLTISLSLAAHFLTGLYSSLLVYRLLLHPLSKFPGPLGARISDLWLSCEVLLRGRRDLHTLTLELRHNYGPFVRVGSSTLMAAHPLAVHAIHGPESRCRKAAMYDFERPNRGIATRDHVVHAERRRIWAQGFSYAALRQYEDRIGFYIQLVLGKLARASQSHKQVETARLMECFAFDVMGDLGLGQNFGMLQSELELHQGHAHSAIDQLVQGMVIMAFRLPLWLLRLLVDVASWLVPTEANTGFLNFCHGQLEVMMTKEKRSELRNLMTPLLDYYEKQKQQTQMPADISALRNDCRFIVIAGSDTVAATLAFIFYHLARHPAHVDKLRQELLPLRLPETEHVQRHYKHQDIQKATHLNAVINETLRLHPPASTIMRITPPEGIVVDTTFIPGNVTVFSSQYVIGRDESVYETAAEFVPERWYARPDMIRHRLAYAPFSVGHHSCLGRGLALMEMRLLVAECVSKYDVSFAPGFDDYAFLHSVQDCMSWHLGKLELCFTECTSSTTITSNTARFTPV